MGNNYISRILTGKAGVTADCVRRKLCPEDTIR